MPISIQLLLLIPTTLLQAIASIIENQQPPLGKYIDVGGYQLHYCITGEANDKPTMVLDHSLGGIEGYLLMEELANLLDCNHTITVSFFPICIDINVSSSVFPNCIDVTTTTSNYATD